MSNRGGAMKRVIRTVIVFLLLGAIVNVAVAAVLASSDRSFVFDREIIVIDDPAVWKVEIRKRRGGTSPSSRLLHIKELDDDRIVIENPDGDDRAAVFIARNGSMIVWLGEGRYGSMRDIRSCQVPRAIDAWLNPTRYSSGRRSLHLYDAAFGWPLPSMCWLNGPRYTKIGRFEYCYYKPASRPPMDRYLVVPLIPLPLGFAVNSVVYGAIIWPIWLIIAAGVRVWVEDGRVERGQCPRCKYPIGTNTVCTECGRELPKRVKAIT